MKIKKSFWIRMIPVFAIVIVTAIMSYIIYCSMLKEETETSWERLEVATKSTAEKMSVCLTDNLNLLEVISDSHVLTNDIENTYLIGNYLSSVIEMTIFDDIDVILPDKKIITKNGKTLQASSDLNYEELIEMGTHISSRNISPVTDKEVLYCFTAVESEGEKIALLCGTIDCEEFGEHFEVFTYNGEAQIFVIDREDGNYIIDTWHDKIDNIYNIGERLSIDGNVMIDMVPAIINGETGRMAFVSKTNGKNLYQYYTPIEGFNWELCIAVQEDVVVKDVKDMRRILLAAGIVEAVLLFIYLAWNIWLTKVSIKGEDRTKKLEMEKVVNEARGNFISNMSHDIRTPLNGITGMLHIIKNNRDDKAKVDECLRKIEVSTQYLNTLANDILDINEIESNKLIFNYEQIDLRKLLNEISTMIEIKAKEAKVEFFVDRSKLKNPYVIGSEVHIERILMNLIGNAVKYSKDNKGKVWLTLEEEENNAKQSTYKFIVKDNGIGMSKEFQKNMYDAFAQERISARSDYQGYGLGLTIVYRLVKKMNGNIELESEKGVGSTFTVSIPLEVTKKDSTSDRVEEESDLTGVKILLVEDNELNMEIAEVLLTDMGAEVDTAVNGREAIEIFEKSKTKFYDLILMDIMMPEMDGCEATKIIREMKRPDAKSVPIIAMTASAFSEEIERCKKAGMNEHIAKPVDVDKLMLKVAKYKRKSSGK